MVHFWWGGREHLGDAAAEKKKLEVKVAVVDR